MHRSRAVFVAIAFAGLALPAAAERFTLAAPLPFEFDGVSGSLLPVSPAEAIGTPECISLSGCVPLELRDALLYRVTLNPGSAPLYQVVAGRNVPGNQASYLPSGDPSAPIPTYGGVADSNQVFRFSDTETLDAGETSPVLITSITLGWIRTRVNGGIVATAGAWKEPGLASTIGTFSLASLDGAPPVSLHLLNEGFTDFEKPVFVTAPAGDSRIFVVEQMSRALLDGTRFGRVRVRPADAPANTVATTFIEVEVAFEFDDPFDERGLLGLAFAPDYATSGAFYIHYVAPDPADPDGPGRITIARHAVSGDPNVANPDGTVLLSIPKPGPPAGDPEAFEGYHNGGSLAFGPDGALYVGIGDGGGWQGYDPWNCAQNPASPLGKILRLDPAVLAASPVIVAAAAQCPTVALPAPAGLELWASGLRNPWRFSFDRELGDLWIGDVGEAMREEINFVAAAALAGAGPNFGWDVEEGSACNPTNPAPSPACGSPALTPPVHDYEHDPFAFGCSGSVIGGFVHRGPVDALRGKYLFGDPCQGFLRTLEPDGVGGLVAVDLPSEIIDQIEYLSSFGEDGSGRAYAIDYARGDLYRLVPEPGTWASGLAALGALAAAATRRRRAARR